MRDKQARKLLEALALRFGAKVYWNIAEVGTPSVRDSHLSVATQVALDDARNDHRLLRADVGPRAERTWIILGALLEHLGLEVTEGNTIRPRALSPADAIDRAVEAALASVPEAKRDRVASVAIAAATEAVCAVTGRTEEEIDDE